VRVAVTRWAAWAPGLETQAAWESWASAPRALPNEGAPAAAFLPPLLRRRATPLTRTLLTAAWECLGAEDLPRLRSVFGSRHGSINESIELIEAVVKREKLSPAVFSHTVHNAQAALFSIAAGNRAASSSLAAQADTFASAFIETLTLLERGPEPVLLAMGDVPLADTFAPLVDEAVTPYAFACRLAIARNGEPGVSIAIRDGGAPIPRTPWPDALEFLRWLLAGEERLVLGSRATHYEFTRS
jgi:hypothetical protein